MNTPICDFVRRYRASDPVRMHMPGHKGVALIGPEASDITEITGADALYSARGIIRESEENAAGRFGSARTVYSAEGSSLCIRAMLHLAGLHAAENGIPRRVLAARNAHQAFMTAAALLDLEVDWIFPSPEEGLLACRVKPETVEKKLARGEYMAVYLTSPDYLGNLQDIRAIASVCRRQGVPLLVDNAHGAYLKFLPEDRHPISLGADLCCDSAHKTLPCLTGAAYLHISQAAPEEWRSRADQAMRLFASTSPSWLILQSLDRANEELAGGYPGRLREAVSRTDALKGRLCAAGWQIAGDEPMKITLDARKRKIPGGELQSMLRSAGIECEFADRDHLVLMPSPYTSDGEWNRLEAALLSLPEGSAQWESPCLVAPPQKAVSVREAMLSPWEMVPVERAAGRILADPCVSCPPAVPVLMAGERITEEAVQSFLYYGVAECAVMMRGLGRSVASVHKQAP